MLKLISYNILYGKALDKILPWVLRAKSRPDIVCFQEFPENKIGVLKKMLKNTTYEFAFAPSFFKHKVQYGELTLFKNFLILTNKKVVNLGEIKLDSRIFRYKSRRSGLMTEFIWGKEKFVISNVHLPWFATAKHRKKQLAKMLTKYDRRLPSIVIGDFNHSNLIGNRAIVNFMKSRSFQLAGENIKTHKFWRIKHQIDYAFYKNLTIDKLQVEQLQYSDHFPILLKFSLK